uniref:J domain-containing protein n=1 Tax=Skeletonema marinoi TaxID=267567 RepID=A0A7S0XMH3_9STRA|mmetsp:Transcript_853/g.1657  ORF Transcript_853/g.1657 Transcript_853/m.1657 type:complete len:208 (+) Transcript_853:87-710(+)
MSTRVTSAASKRAKATLIELLFPRQQAKRYSHLQLRMAYLQKVHIMHPDKQRLSSSTRDESAHEQFVQLQNAWEAYNISARMFHKTNHGKSKQGENSDDDDKDDFTMFGVGCSFSDSPEERRLRDEIMEQACRGWLPSGALSHSFDATEKAKKEVKSPQQATKLSDDNLFIQQQTSEESIGSTNVQNVNAKKSLVQNVENYRIKRKP